MGWISPFVIVRRELAEHFAVKSLGDVRYVLGMEVKYDMEKGELWLGQQQFVEHLYWVKNYTLKTDPLVLE
ncbi:hypothetical protein PI124_g24618 [Phytophthora idaei]|nr:hypothetical protein PI124_g24618 [Phytophthora idaei]